MTNDKNNHRSKLLPEFFNRFKQQFVYQEHSPYLVTVSREPVEVKTNTTGVIISMVDNQFGILQFPSGNGTEKALFAAKALFSDGYPYQDDPMKLPGIRFCILSLVTWHLYGFQLWNLMDIASRPRTSRLETRMYPTPGKPYHDES